MVDFSLQYGQARVATWKRGEIHAPLEMYYRAASPKRAIEMASDGPQNVRYEAMGEDGLIDVRDPRHIAILYINGWPLLIGTVAGAGDAPEFVRDTAPEVARRGLNALSDALFNTFIRLNTPELSFDAEATRAQITDLAASRITDPWDMFGIPPGTGKYRIDLNSPPSGLAFPRPELTTVTGAEDVYFQIVHDNAPHDYQALEAFADGPITYPNLRRAVESFEASGRGN